VGRGHAVLRLAHPLPVAVIRVGLIGSNVGAGFAKTSRIETANSITIGARPMDYGLCQVYQMILSETAGRRVSLPLAPVGLGLVLRHS
jgi:hypothetical protein